MPLFQVPPSAQRQKTPWFSLSGMEMKNENSDLVTYECCICGDVGIQKELFQCQICLGRLQHRYCSRLYGNSHRTAMPEWVCEWCLHEREKQKIETEVGSRTKTTRTPKYRYRSLATLL